jgi:TonB family protein
MHHTFTFVSVIVFLLFGAVFLAENAAHSKPVTSRQRTKVQKPIASTPLSKPAPISVHAAPFDGWITDWGLAIRYCDGKLLVEQLLPNSKAITWRIVRGDEVIEINGLPTNTYNSEQIKQFLHGSYKMLTLASGKHRLTFNGVLGSTRPPLAAATPSQRSTQAQQAESPVSIHKPVISTRLPEMPRHPMGNIAPYRKEVLHRFYQNWHPTRKVQRKMILLLTISRDGSVCDAELFERSGDRKSDDEVLRTASDTQFEPLPEWFKGESLTFKLAIDSAEIVQDD